MRVLILECTAEELRLNRTILNSVVDAINGFTQELAGIDLTDIEPEEEEDAEEEED